MSNKLNREEYIIVVSTDPEKLAELVCKNMDDWYCPHGSMIAVNYGEDGVHLMQPMVKNNHDINW